MQEPDVLARFDPKLKIYLLVTTGLTLGAILGATVFGLLLWPAWLVIGPIWVSRYFPSIEARLTGRSLVYKHGVLFRQEMSIPLDKIQDLSLHHGPVLDAFGLSTLRVDTAGSGTPGSSSANLIGVIDAAAFRAQVIARRDADVSGPPVASDDAGVLREIRDALLRIEARIPGE